MTGRCYDWLDFYFDNLDNVVWWSPSCEVLSYKKFKKKKKKKNTKQKTGQIQKKKKKKKPKPIIKHLNQDISRSKFEAMSEEVIKKIIAFATTSEKLDKVVLTGGLCKTPILANKLSELYKEKVQQHGEDLIVIATVVKGIQELGL